MRVKKTVLILLVCLFIQACDNADIRKAAKASDDMARGISVALDLDAALIQQGLLSNDEAIAVTSALLDLNRLAREFNDTARGFKALDGAAKASLLQILTSITASLDKLNTQGVLRIKNAEAQQKFKTALAVITAAVNILAATLAKGN